MCLSVGLHDGCKQKASESCAAPAAGVTNTDVFDYCHSTASVLPQLPELVLCQILRLFDGILVMTERTFGKLTHSCC